MVHQIEVDVTARRSIKERMDGPIGKLIHEVQEKGGVIMQVEIKPTRNMPPAAEEVSDGQVEYGIFATGSINMGEVLISLPVSQCISAEMVRANTSLKCIFECEDFAGLVAYPDEVVALGLMAAKQYELPWSAHVRTMPQQLNSTIFWEESEVEILHPSTIYHLTKMMKRRIEQDWISIHEPISKAYPNLLGSSTLDLYKWALGIIYSRAVGFYKDSNYFRCIPPLIDMANHSPLESVEAADTFRYDAEADLLQFLSCRSCSEGDECFAVYGTYPNSKLIYSYGFVVVDNPCKAIDLWTRVGPTTLHAEKKQAILSSSELTRDQPYDFSGTIRPGYISPALLATVRVLQCTEDELEPSAIENIYSGKMCSKRNELATYKSLQALLRAKSSIGNNEEDVHELMEMKKNNIPISDRRYMALALRVEERKLLEETVFMIDNLWLSDGGNDIHQSRIQDIL